MVIDILYLPDNLFLPLPPSIPRKDVGLLLSLLMLPASHLQAYDSENQSSILSLRKSRSSRLLFPFDVQCSVLVWLSKALFCHIACPSPEV